MSIMGIPIDDYFSLLEEVRRIRKGYPKYTTAVIADTGDNIIYKQDVTVTEIKYKVTLTQIVPQG